MTKEIKKDEVVIEETVVEEAVTTPKETASRKSRTRKTKPKTVKHSVTVYSKPNCQQCNFTKKYLDEMGTPYNEVDITKDEEALEQLRHHGYLGVPVVAINSLDDSWGGFRPDELEKLRGIKK